MTSTPLAHHCGRVDVTISSTISSTDVGELLCERTADLDVAKGKGALVEPLPGGGWRAMVYVHEMHLEHVAVIVDDYDSAIAFYVQALGFELVEDSPSLTNDGRPKRWVVVRPPGARTGLLLARSDGEPQSAAVGTQFAGRVGLFLRVDDFDSSHRRMVDHGVEFLTAPRDEPYGRVAVFVDVAGNKWDLLGPRN